MKKTIGHCKDSHGYRTGNVIEMIIQDMRMWKRIPRFVLFRNKSVQVKNVTVTYTDNTALIIRSDS